VNGVHGWNINIVGSYTANRSSRYNSRWDTSGSERMTSDYSGNLSVAGKITNTGGIMSGGEISTGTNLYSYAGGLLIGGLDGNTFNSGDRNIGMTFNTGYNFTVNSWGGSCALLTVHNSSAVS
jgi:hypothetical protein